MTEIVPLGCTRLITFSYFRPGSAEHETFTVRPDRPNRMPADLFGYLLARKDSDGVSPMSRYLESGIVFRMRPEEANAVLAGEAKIIPPAGPRAGIPEIVPELADVPRSELARKIEQQLLDGDPNAEEFELTAEPQKP